MRLCSSVGTASIKGDIRMMTMPAIVADELGTHLTEDFRQLFGSGHRDEAECLDGIARIALECLGKSDALYRNVEHTFLVTQVGRDILRGRMLTERLEPEDHSHLIIACLLHDIGWHRQVNELRLERRLCIRGSEGRRNAGHLTPSHKGLHP